MSDGAWQNRIIGLELRKPSQLLDHPMQHKTHPDAQVVALRALLEQVGIVGTLLVYTDAQGRERTLDGHMRKSLDPNVEWPCLMLDLTEEEADLMLSTYDAIGREAGIRLDLMRKLHERVEPQVVGRPELRSLMNTIAARAEMAHAVHNPPPPEPPPDMEFPVYDEDTIVVDHHCPSCGYEWSGSCR